NMFAETFVNVGGKQKYTVLVSFVVHTLVISALLIVPLVATDQIVLPTRFTRIAFPNPPPVPPPAPPLPRGPATAPPLVVTSVVPTVAPTGITPEIPIQAISDPGLEYIPGIVPGGEYSATPASASVPAAPSPAQVPLRPGSDIRRPVKVRDVAPPYPALARAAHKEGVVI